VRDGKGEKDRVTLLPEALVEPLKQHLLRVHQAHERALAEGYAGVALPAWRAVRKGPLHDRGSGIARSHPVESG